MESVTTYCQASYLLSGKATYCQACTQQRIHAPNRAIDMHPKAAYMHPKVSIDLHPTTAYFAPNRAIDMHPKGIDFAPKRHRFAPKSSRIHAPSFRNFYMFLKVCRMAVTLFQTSSRGSELKQNRCGRKFRNTVNMQS